MNAFKFDAITKLMAERRMTRRDALAQTGVGLAAGAAAVAGISVLKSAPKAAAQDATPSASPEADTNPFNTPMLFVQSFQSGSLEAMGDEPHRYTVSLESGLGQTIYFSDRPARVVGAMPTADFIDVLGFTADNPPNAALLVEREEGHTDFAVVELFNPVYDAANANITYEITALDSWEKVAGQEFTHNPPEPPPATFGTTYLLIDGIADCPDAVMSCLRDGKTIGTLDDHNAHCYSWAEGVCVPCTPWGAMPSEFSKMCNDRFAECGGECGVWNYCSWDNVFGNTLCNSSDSSS